MGANSPKIWMIFWSRAHLFVPSAKILCKREILFFFFFFFLGPHLWHMEVPKLGVKLELQLLAYATATEMQDAGSEPRL